MAEGRKVYKLGLGQSPFPVPDHVVAALQANAFQTDYLPVKGLPALREVICNFYERITGVKHDPAYTVIGPGSKELLFLLQLVYYGELVIPTPSWVSYAPQARIIGRNIPAEKRSWAMGLVSSAGSFGQFLLVPSSSYLIQEFGWQQAVPRRPRCQVRDAPACDHRQPTAGEGSPRHRPPPRAHR
mgnify:CR=1 FL=1